MHEQIGADRCADIYSETQPERSKLKLTVTTITYIDDNKNGFNSLLNCLTISKGTFIDKHQTDKTKEKLFLRYNIKTSFTEKAWDTLE